MTAAFPTCTDERASDGYSISYERLRGKMVWIGYEWSRLGELSYHSEATTPPMSETEARAWLGIES